MESVLWFVMNICDDIEDVELVYSILYNNIIKSLYIGEER